MKPGNLIVVVSWIAGLEGVKGSISHTRNLWLWKIWKFKRALNLNRQHLEMTIAPPYPLGAKLSAPDLHGLITGHTTLFMEVRKGNIPLSLPLSS